MSVSTSSFTRQIDALCEAIREFTGGVVVVSHDARLILETDCKMWVCDKQNVLPFDGDFHDYRDHLLEVGWILASLLPLRIVRLVTHVSCPFLFPGTGEGGGGVGEAGREEGSADRGG